MSDCDIRARRASASCLHAECVVTCVMPAENSDLRASRTARTAPASTQISPFAGTPIIHRLLPLHLAEAVFLHCQDALRRLNFAHSQRRCSCHIASTMHVWKGTRPVLCCERPAD